MPSDTHSEIWRLREEAQQALELARGAPIGTSLRTELWNLYTKASVRFHNIAVDELRELLERANELSTGQTRC